MGQSAQSAPAVPDDRAGRTRRNVGREKFARDFVSVISCARQTPLCKRMKVANLTESDAVALCHDWKGDGNER